MWFSWLEGEEASAVVILVASLLRYAPSPSNDQLSRLRDVGLVDCEKTSKSEPHANLGVTWPIGEHYFCRAVRPKFL